MPSLAPKCSAWTGLSSSWALIHLCLGCFFHYPNPIYLTKEFFLILLFFPSFHAFVTAPRSQTTPKSYEWPSSPSRKVGKNCKATYQTLMIGCVNIHSAYQGFMKSCCRPHNGALVAKFMRLSGVILVERSLPASAAGHALEINPRRRKIS